MTFMRCGFGLDQRLREQYLFLLFGQDKYHQYRSVSVDEEQERFELMYRQPGCSTHQNITDVLDEIIIALRDLTERVIELEDKD